MERIRSSQPARGVVAELLEATHDLLLHDLPNSTSKPQVEGAVLELRRMMKKILE